MKRLWMSGAAVLMAVSVAGLNAQSTGSQPPHPQTPQVQTPQPPATATAHATASTTLRGCVYKEEAIAGRTPNVAEKAGVMEDYILVAEMDHSTMGTSGTTAATGTTPPTATTPATGTAGAPPMMHYKAYKLEKIADERLRAVVGKMVEVTGKADAERSDTKPAGTTGTAGAPAADTGLGPDKIELPEFEVTDLKEVTGTCPATPTIKK